MDKEANSRKEKTKPYRERKSHFKNELSIHKTQLQRLVDAENGVCVCVAYKSHFAHLDLSSSYYSHFSGFSSRRKTRFWCENGGQVGK